MKNPLSNVLNRLLFERKMKPTELARKLDIPQPTIHRLVTGKSSRPHPATLKPIAEYFDVTVEQLNGMKPLDNTQPSKGLQIPISGIPLIQWDQLNSPFNQTTKHIAPSNRALSPTCFATMMANSSMSPQFPKNSILIMDPTKNPTDRSYVLIKLAESAVFTFRQLLINGDQHFLKPLNPDLTTFPMKLLNNKDELIGVLVEARHNFLDEE